MRIARLPRFSVTVMTFAVLAGGAWAAQGPTTVPPTPVEDPPVPMLKSPVAVFRELLSMGPAERQTFLETRPPENQRSLERKLREYESLDRNEREWRLQATELRFYLMPLMSAAPTNRPTQLKALPAGIRPLVVNRLRSWDALPEETRQELLANEAAMRYFTGAGAPPVPPQAETSTPRPGGDRVEASLERWRAMPPGERLKAQQRFNLFFELSATEKERAMKNLSEEERRQIEKTLGVFSDLPPAQRAQCIRAFNSFVGLSPEDRRQFLRNAQVWSRMTPGERNEWRALVDKLSHQPAPPPVPGDAPVPPGANTGRTAALATNH